MLRSIFHVSPVRLVPASMAIAVMQPRISLPSMEHELFDRNGCTPMPTRDHALSPTMRQPAMRRLPLPGPLWMPTLPG